MLYVIFPIADKISAIFSLMLLASHRANVQGRYCEDDQNKTNRFTRSDHQIIHIKKKTRRRKNETDSGEIKHLSRNSTEKTNNLNKKEVDTTYSPLLFSSTDLLHRISFSHHDAATVFRIRSAKIASRRSLCSRLR